jgi:hypothetical protein
VGACRDDLLRTPKLGEKMGAHSCVQETQGSLAPSAVGSVNSAICHKVAVFICCPRGSFVRWIGITLAPAPALLSARANARAVGMGREQREGEGVLGRESEGRVSGYGHARGHAQEMGRRCAIPSPVSVYVPERSPERDLPYHAHHTLSLHMLC